MMTMDTKTGKKTRRSILICQLYLLICIVLCLILSACGKRELKGGELFAPDLENGVCVYVEEGYTKEAVAAGAYTGPPHSLWKITDEDMIQEIMGLCGKIRQYRQFEKASDIMLGPFEYVYLPQLYLITDEICYKIEILNWDFLMGHAWSGLRIRQELPGEPVMHVYRIDLSSYQDDKAPYIFAREYDFSDSVNSESGLGWYSTLSPENMDRLLALLQNIGNENAEIVDALYN